MSRLSFGTQKVNLPSVFVFYRRVDIVFKKYLNVMKVVVANFHKMFGSVHNVNSWQALNPVHMEEPA